MQEYVRDITLPLILKAIRINIRMLSVLMLSMSFLVVSIVVFMNKHHRNIYYTTGAVKINNYTGTTRSDRDISMPDAKEADTPGAVLATQSEVEEALIKTGYILMPVIKKNHLDIKISQINTPIIGKIIQNYCKTTQQKSGWITNYCKRGAGLIDVNEFDVDSEYLNENFVIKATSTTTYDLLSGKKLILSGKSGQLVSTAGIKIYIESMNVEKDAKFSISKTSMDRAINSLSAEINIEPVIVGKNFVPPVTGILKISMTGEDPKLQAILINDIIDQLKITALMQQTTVLRSSITFVDEQINVISEKLAQSQAHMVAFQSSHNIISLDEQQKAYIQQQATVEQSLLENRIAVSQFSNLYANKHPVMIDLYAQRDFLTSKKSKIDSNLQKLPGNGAVYLNLKRDLDVYQQLYSFLLNKEQDLKLKLSSLSSPVDILYYATSEVAPSMDDLSPKVIAGLVFVSLAGILVIFMSVVFLGNSDPWLMSELSQTPLLTVFPYNSRKHKTISRSLEITASYLLHRGTTGSQVVNIGGITTRSGKTFIIRELMKYLNILNKKCLYITFGLESNYMMIQPIISLLKKESKIIKNAAELQINLINAMDDTQMLQLIAELNEFDFIFMESPAAEKSALFLNLARVANENILVIAPKDTRNKIEWLINDITNLKVYINQIIYNNPKSTIIKSLFAVESYNK